MKGRTPLFSPCTAVGCIEIMKRNGVNLSGKNVVVLGRSNIVGIPISMLCLQENATVTICHSKTLDIESHMRRADIVIAAIGIAKFVKVENVKAGVIVVDVGINSIEDSTRKSGYRLVGDVDFEGVKTVASMITPVPGGVGPMTVAILMENTFIAATRRAKQK